MTTYHFERIKCPFCQNEILLRQEAFPIGDMCWSDGYSHAFFMSDHEGLIAQCEQCKSAFWPEDIEQGSTVRSINKEVSTDYEDIFSIHTETVEKYRQFVNDGLGNTRERESYLRLRLLWAINDIRRESSQYLSLIFKIKSLTNLRILKNALSNETKIRELLKNYEMLYQDNLEKLENLISEKPSVLLAEIQRNSGMFQECKSTLKNIRPNENMGQNGLLQSVLHPEYEKSGFFREAILKAAKSKNSKLLLL